MRFALRASVVFAVALLIAASGAFAQRGGGHASGGHAFGGGFSGGHSFGSSFSSAPRSFGSIPRMDWSGPIRSYSQGFSAPRFSAVHSPYFGRGQALNGNRSSWQGGRTEYRRGGDYGRYRYRSPYRAYAGSVWLSPWELGYPDFYGYDDTGSQDSGSADVQSAQAPEYQTEPQDYAPEGTYRSGYTSASAPVAAPSPEPVLTIVFRDGHTQQIHNYALTPSTLIVLDEAASGRQQRIALDQINLPATEQSARDAGLDFRPPSA
jgi:hypothetical protein